jgi:hypothetical protein
MLPGCVDRFEPDSGNDDAERAHREEDVVQDPANFLLQAAVFRGRSVELIPRLNGEVSSQAVAINDVGTVVVTSFDQNGAGTLAVYQNGRTPVAFAGRSCIKFSHDRTITPPSVCQPPDTQPEHPCETHSKDDRQSSALMDNLGLCARALYRLWNRRRGDIHPSGQPDSTARTRIDHGRHAYPESTDQR